MLSVFVVNIWLLALTQLTVDLLADQSFNPQGKKNPFIDRQSVLTFLNQVKTAKEMNIDR